MRKKGINVGDIIYKQASQNNAVFASHGLVSLSFAKVDGWMDRLYRGDEKCEMR